MHLIVLVFADDMIRRFMSVKDRVRFSEIAEKWGVSPVQISKDQKGIMEMVRRKAEEIRKAERE